MENNLEELNWKEESLRKQTDEESDYEFALALQSQYDEDEVVTIVDTKEKSFLKQTDEESDEEFDSFLQSQLNKVKESTNVDTKGDSFFNDIDKDLDYAFALSLQSQYDEEVNENSDINSQKLPENKNLSIVDKQWEFIDPHPDIHALFIEYDNKFFYGKLKGVEVRWSPRMTLCAGVCCYEGRGGLCSVRLSEPLLKLRPRRDLVETLLHEMIHAYLFVTNNNKDRDGHGPEFLSHMNRINKATGTKITVYHSFHDEVDLYRKHWWKCDGPCKNKRPFYGLVKRAMNRAPGPKDHWWSMHQTSCGGNFVKIKEPDDYGKKKTTKRKTSPSASKSKRPSPDIRGFLKSDSSPGNFSDNSTLKSTVTKSATRTNFISSLQNVVSVNSVTPKKSPYIPFQGAGQKLGGSSETKSKYPWDLFKNPSGSLKKQSSSREVTDVTLLSKDSKSAKISNSNKIVPAFKAQQSSKASSSNHSKTSMVQSPIEKFLSGSPTNIKNMKEEKVPEIKTNDISQVPCPVCFILVKAQEINSHLDACLK